MLLPGMYYISLHSAELPRSGKIWLGKDLIIYTCVFKKYTWQCMFVDVMVQSELLCGYFAYLTHSYLATKKYSNIYLIEMTTYLLPWI